MKNIKAVIATVLSALLILVSCQVERCRLGDVLPPVDDRTTGEIIVSTVSLSDAKGNTAVIDPEDVVLFYLQLEALECTVEELSNEAPIYTAKLLSKAGETVCTVEICSKSLLRIGEKEYSCISGEIDLEYFSRFFTEK